MIQEAHTDLKIESKYLIDPKMIKESIENTTTAKGTWCFKEDIHDEGEALIIIKW